mmetsp:Transcript_23924/g.54102  ORF Transcript_23924/g.54102 Transcript_23924/m.54102 type:complete len:312 (+) Transcript_23924:51-986(+)
MSSSIQPSMSSPIDMRTRLHPPFALDDDEEEGSVWDDNDKSPGFRTGGPKQARLKRVELLAKDTDHLYPVKIGNIPKNTSTEALLHTFGDLGEIGDVYIPTNLKSGQVAKDFAILRFEDKKIAEVVLEAAGRSIGGQSVVVSPLKKQASFFSNHTGRLGISNEVVPEPETEKKQPLEQHISLEFVRSRAGYPWGSVRELKYLNPKPPSTTLELYSLHLQDLPRHITPHQLEVVFSAFGELEGVHSPRPTIVTQQTNEANCGHAFIRYKDKRDLMKARKELDEGRIEIDGCVLHGETQNPSHWPTEKTRRFY